MKASTYTHLDTHAFPIYCGELLKDVKIIEIRV